MNRLVLVAAMTMGLSWAGADDAPKDAAAKELKAFEGKWQVTGISEGGKADPAESVKELSVVIAGDKMSVFEGKEKAKEYIISLDPTKTPKQIELVADGEAKKKAGGIYEFKGNTLKICVDEAGKVRPTGFEGGTEQKTWSVITLERVKP